MSVRTDRRCGGALTWRASDPNRSLISICKLQLPRWCQLSRLSNLLLSSPSLTFFFHYSNPSPTHPLFPALLISSCLLSILLTLSPFSSTAPFICTLSFFWLSPFYLVPETSFFFPPPHLTPPPASTFLPLGSSIAVYSLFLSSLVAWQIMLAVHEAIVDGIIAHFTGIFMWSVI